MYLMFAGTNKESTSPHYKYKYGTILYGECRHMIKGTMDNICLHITNLKDY